MLAEIIPDSFFLARGAWQLWLLTAGGIVILVYGADRAVAAAVRVASELGMSKIIIGATVVSLGTTAPETVVSVMAAIQGQPGLALGNGVGSIICDTALIFGLSACIARLPKNRFILYRHGMLKMGSGVLLAATLAILALLHGGFVGVVMPRFVGGIYVLLLVAYMAISVHWARQRPGEAVELAKMEGAEKARPTLRAAMLNVAVLAFGLALVIGGSDVLVGSVSRLCVIYGVPDSVLAVTVVALGTSLPELATAIASIVKGHPELLVGNVIGADILNVLFVIGASALAQPLQVPPEFYYLHVPVMLLSMGLMLSYILMRRPMFQRWQGVPLLVVFAGYYAALLILVRMNVLTVGQ